MRLVAADCKEPGDPVTGFFYSHSRERMPFRFSIERYTFYWKEVTGFWSVARGRDSPECVHLM